MSCQESGKNKPHNCLKTYFMKVNIGFVWCVWGGIRIQVHADSQSWQQLSSSVTLHFIYQGGVSHWSQSLPILPALATLTQESPLCLSLAGGQHTRLALTRVLLMWTLGFTVAQQALYPLSQLSRPWYLIKTYIYQKLGMKVNWIIIWRKIYSYILPQIECKDL